MSPSTDTEKEGAAETPTKKIRWGLEEETAREGGQLTLTYNLVLSQAPGRLLV